MLQRLLAAQPSVHGLGWAGLDYAAVCCFGAHNTQGFWCLAGHAGFRMPAAVTMASLVVDAEGQASAVLLRDVRAADLQCMRCVCVLPALAVCACACLYQPYTVQLQWGVDHQYITGCWTQNCTAAHSCMSID